MTTTNENTPAPAATGNEGNESFPEHSPNNFTRLRQAIVNALFELIIDTKFEDREEPPIIDTLTLEDVEEICRSFNIPLPEVLEAGRRAVAS